jgi:crotonobetainyl-CoA:carnitine CoA-transferase CaiB-like acyl-CoA transferase
MKPAPSLPLSGIRIIDLSTVLVGPFCTQILADYGAEVIKVEPPEGDILRLAGPMRNPMMGPMFLHANRNKRGMVLDLSVAEAREALLRLVTTADMFVTNIRPAAMRRLGLDHAGVAAVKPDIVYLAITGYGQDGPYRAKPAVDDAIQAASGAPSLFTRTMGTDPAYVPLDIADRVAALTAVHAAMAALMHRQRTGEGQMVEVPMFESMASLVLADHMGGRTYDPPVGPMGYSRLLTPHRRPFRTQDGFVGVLIYTDRHWRSLFAAIGRTEILERDPRFSTAAIRAHHYDAVYAFLTELFEERRTEDWLALLEANDIPCSPVHTLDSLMDDPHLDAVRLFETMEHPSEGRTVQMRPPTRWSSLALDRRNPAPRLGENTRDILRTSGFTAEEVEALAAARAIPPN